MDYEDEDLMYELADAEQRYASVNAVECVTPTGRDPYARVLIFGPPFFTIVPTRDRDGGWEFTYGHNQNAPAGPDGYPMYKWPTLVEAIEATRDYW